MLSERAPRCWLAVVQALAGVACDGDRAAAPGPSFEPPRAPAPLPSLEAPSAAAERDALRDQARVLLEAQCGECHIGTLASALPGALRVYDLSELEWPARMTPAQLRQLPERVDVPIPAGELPVVPEQLTALRAFVAAEIEARGGPDPGTDDGDPAPAPPSHP
jgi:mono/diheme cytochrome c family protein